MVFSNSGGFLIWVVLELFGEFGDSIKVWILFCFSVWVFMRFISFLGDFDVY